MKKKTWIAIAGVFAVIAILLCMHVSIGQKAIRAYTYTEIENRGYTTSDICNIKIDHSYIRRLLGYNEWRISVEFEKEPNVFFWFTYKDKQILFTGVSSEPMMDKDSVIAYSESFKNGSLLTN